MENNIIKVEPISVKIAVEETGIAETMLIDAREIAIKNQLQYEDAARFLKKVKFKIDWLEKEEKKITSPLNLAKAAVKDLFRKPLGFLRQAEGITKNDMSNYDTEQERIVKEQQDKLDREAKKKEDDKKKRLEERAKNAEAVGNKGKAEELREQAEEVKVEAPVVAPRVDKIKGVYTTESWYAEVVNFEMLPNTYKTADMTSLNKVAQATKGQIKIPGVVFKSKKGIASRKE